MPSESTGSSFSDATGDFNFLLILKPFSCAQFEKEGGLLLLDSSYAAKKPTSDPKFACARQSPKKEHLRIQMMSLTLSEQIFDAKLKCSQFYAVIKF